MSVAGYLRVSSRAQDTATQRAAIERAAAARGDAVTGWYSEKRSGKTLARPELERLRADARAGHIQKLYVFKLDRLTSSGIRDTFEVIEELRASGCQLVSVSDGFSLDGPAAEIIPRRHGLGCEDGAPRHQRAHCGRARARGGRRRQVGAAQPGL